MDWSILCVCVCVCVRAHTYFQNAEKGVKLVLPRKVLKCSSQWTLTSPTRKTYFIDSCDSFKEVAQLNTLQWAHHFDILDIFTQNFHPSITRHLKNRSNLKRIRKKHGEGKKKKEYGGNWSIGEERMKETSSSLRYMQSGHAENLSFKNRAKYFRYNNRKHMFEKNRWLPRK